MKRQEFISELVKILISIDKGMAEFSTPLPSNVEKGIIQAIVAFNEEALLELHTALTTWQSQIDLVHLIDVLGIIGNTSSASHIIKFHSQYASFISGVAAVQALKNIGTEEAYIYLGTLLTQYAAGKNLFNTGAEIPIACEALGDWDDERAILFLEQATTIHDPNRMPEAALEQLVKFPAAHQFLTELAKNNLSLRDIIEKALRARND